MLKPAQLYKDVLEESIVKRWYDEDYKYYSGWVGNDIPSLPDNCYDSHDFVSVDNCGQVIGYISYRVSYITMSADNFGAISFDRGNPVFIKDLFTAINNLFEIYHMNRIQWRAIADNPIAKSYRRFAQRHGGVECAHYRQVAKLQDGLLHDVVEFEILASEYTKQSL